jgi:hypothetical protein
MSTSLLHDNERQCTTYTGHVFSTSSCKERPMLAKLNTFALVGIDAVPVVVEVSD